MKKNISINISGIIFHIEEDGYENLRRYLDSINKYFSSFEDSTEIMADIESRIAEIFLSKLNEGKQIITAEDVNSLITTMGSVSDFKAAEAQEFAEAKNGTKPSEASSSTTSDTNTAYTETKSTTGSKNLVRDQQRKILGGVCAGLANYLNIDIVWVRLLFAILAFAWGVTIIIYVIMWAVVPGSYELSEVEVGKKMFRDPDRKVLGGVSGGLASYLNIDIIAVRVLFIIFTITAGIGLFIYVILWIILPEARTLTERMQMQGEPVTLSNIESNIKKNQSADPNAEESALTKVILFPFRLIGMLLQALAKILVPIVEILRIAIGIIAVLIGLSLALGVVIAGGMLLGIFSSSTFGSWTFGYQEMSLPFDAFTRAFPSWLAVTGFIVSLIPAIFIILLGVSIVARRVVFSTTIGWSLFVLFFVCVAILSVGIPKVVYAFKEDGEYKVENSYKTTGKPVVFRITESGMDDYHGAAINIRGYDEPNIKIVQEYQAQGPTRQKAIENAKMVTYNIQVQDTVFTFDSNLSFNPDAIFRAQHLNVFVYVPYNYPFVMDEGMSRYISEYVSPEYRDGYTWKMTTEKGLTCVTCPQEETSEDGDEETKVELSNFEELDLHGIFDVRIHRGDQFSVELDGPEKEKKKYNIYRTGHKLVIDFEGKKKFNWDWNFDKVMTDEVHIDITMPDLEKLEAVGFGNITFDQFETNDLEIEVRGPIKVRGNVIAEDLMVSLSGKSEADLAGRANHMNANIEFASKLKAYDLEVRDAVVEATGASAAKLNVTESLDMDEGLGSHIDYRGNPHVTEHHD
jgi:phage shock protein PspC (stress-responsive transcriptional regulator)